MYEGEGIRNQESGIGEEGVGEGDRELRKLLHQTIQRVTIDLDRFSLNTAISRMMELVNGMYKYKESGIRNQESGIWKECLETIPKLLSPYAPHFAEEMWERIGGKGLVMESEWPQFDPSMIKESQITIVVQVNGRVRDKLEVPAGTSMDQAKEMALGLPKIKQHLDGKEGRKVITVPDKLVNIVVEGA